MLSNWNQAKWPKVLSYQLYAIVIGCLNDRVSVIFYKIKYRIIILLFIFLGYIFIIHNVYLNKVYPKMLF